MADQISLQRLMLPQTKELKRAADLTIDRIRLSRAPALEAMESLRAIHMQTEGEIALAHKRAEVMRKHLEDVGAPAEALEALNARTTEFEIYATRLNRALNEKLVAVIESSPTEAQPEEPGYWEEFWRKEKLTWQNMLKDLGQAFDNNMHPPHTQAPRR